MESIVKYAIEATDAISAEKLVWCGSGPRRAFMNYLNYLNDGKGDLPEDLKKYFDDSICIFDTKEDVRDELIAAMNSYPTFFCKIIEITNQIWRLDCKASSFTLTNKEFPSSEKLWKFIEKLDKKSIEDISIVKQYIPWRNADSFKDFD